MEFNLGPAHKQCRIYVEVGWVRAQGTPVDAVYGARSNFAVIDGRDIRKVGHKPAWVFNI